MTKNYEKHNYEVQTYMVQFHHQLIKHRETFYAKCMTNNSLNNDKISKFRSVRSQQSRSKRICLFYDDIPFETTCRSSVSLILMVSRQRKLAFQVEMKTKFVGLFSFFTYF